MRPRVLYVLLKVFVDDTFWGDENEPNSKHVAYRSLPSSHVVGEVYMGNNGAAYENGLFSRLMLRYEAPYSSTVLYAHYEHTEHESHNVMVYNTPSLKWW